MRRSDYNQQKKAAAQAARLGFFLRYIDRPEMPLALAESRAQLQQDVFAYVTSNFKTQGFFVEFGASDGLLNSNTFLLEKEFGWDGILAEPARYWHSEIRANRSAAIDTRAVWSESGRVSTFWETQNPELSTLAKSAPRDHLSKDRKNRTAYRVETVSLNDLLVDHQAPREIDFLSVDVEGAEGAVLESFDFNTFTVRALVVEHNFGRQQKAIDRLLVSKGFVRLLEAGSLWDGWYVNKNLASNPLPFKV